MEKNNEMLEKENVEAVRLFIEILRDTNLREEYISLVVSLLQTMNNMDEMVLFLEKNMEATEEEIIAKAEELRKLNSPARTPT